MAAVESSDRWNLGLRGQRVTAVSRAGGLAMHLDSGAVITVGPDTVLTQGAVTAPAAEIVRVADVPDVELEALAGKIILSAVAFKTGSLRIVLDNGRHLNTRASDTGAAARIDWPGQFIWSYGDAGPEMTIMDT